MSHKRKSVSVAVTLAISGGLAIIPTTTILAADVVIDGESMFISDDSENGSQFTVSNNGSLVLSGAKAGEDGSTHYINGSSLSVLNDSELLGKVISDASFIVVENSRLGHSLTYGSSGGIGDVTIINSDIYEISSGSNNHNKTINISDSSIGSTGNSLNIASGRISVANTDIRSGGGIGGVVLQNAEYSFMHNVNLEYNSNGGTATAALDVANTDTVIIKDSDISSTAIGIKLDSNNGESKDFWMTNSTVIAENSSALAIKNYDVDIQKSTMISTAVSGSGVCSDGTIQSSGCGALHIKGGSVTIRDDSSIQSQNTGVLITADANLNINNSVIYSKEAAITVSGGQSSIQLNNAQPVSSGIPSISSANNIIMNVSNNSKVDLYLKNIYAVGDIIASTDSNASVILDGNSLLVGDLKGVDLFEINRTSQWILQNSNALKDLVFTGGIISFGHDDDIYHTLNIENLSGAGMFRMNTNLQTMQGDLLNITGDALGSYILAVSNTGSEPTNAADVLKLVYDASGKGIFYLENGKVDVGVWQYGLFKDGSNWYLGTGNSPELPDEGPDDDVGTIPDEDKPGDDGSDDDIGTTPDGDENGDDESSPPGNTPDDRPDNTSPGWSTTPSTDAVLNLAASSVAIFNSELQNLRKRRGDIHAMSREDSNLWGRYLNGYSHNSTASHSAFNLRQNGFEIGREKTIEAKNGNLLLGIFGGYTYNAVENERGGKSKVDSYSIGLNATWLSNTGAYLDGVLKANNFRNRLNTVMTDGAAVTSKYNQNGIGGAVEAGWHFPLNDLLWVEPYSRISAFTAEGSKTQLSNGMKAKISNPRSLQTEAGVYIGAKMDIGSATTLQPYVKASISRENVKNNKVLLNDRWSFNNGSAGNAENYGSGIDVSMNESSSVFFEINYNNGKYTESPINGNVGIRVSF